MLPSMRGESDSTLVGIIEKLQIAGEALQTDSGRSAESARRMTFAFFLQQCADRLKLKLPFPCSELEDLTQVQRSPMFQRIEIELAKETIDPHLIDQVFERISPLTYRKRFGQFLTPPEVAEFMASWGVSKGCRSVLDPAVGTGVFLDGIARLSAGSKVRFRGIDIDPLMLNASYIRTQLLHVDTIELTQADFLRVTPIGEYDFIICNPPYLNFHDFDRDIVTTMATQAGVPLSRLTNIYPLFFIQSFAFAQDGATMAFITPSEFFYTGYGKQLRKFLLRNFTIDAFILVDFERTLFEGVLTTATITLLRKQKAPEDHMVKFIRVFNWPPESDVLLEAVRSATPNPAFYKITEANQSALDPTEKWLKYFEENHLGGVVDRLIPLSRIARVHRGIATGDNSYFTLSDIEATKWGIEKRFLRPVLARTHQCPTIEFTRQDHEALVKRGEKVLLLYCSEAPSRNLGAYIRHGERQGVNKRYIPSHRTPWYSMERREPAPILATVFSRRRMRFILNSFKALNLAAYHCIYPTFDDLGKTKALLAYLNSDLCKQVQVVSRREYGGGLHKFEPKDLEQLPVLDVTALEKEHVDSLASLFDRLESEMRRGGDVLEIEGKITGLVTRCIGR